MLCFMKDTKTDPRFSKLDLVNEIEDNTNNPKTVDDNTAIHTD